MMLNCSVDTKVEGLLLLNLVRYVRPALVSQGVVSDDVFQLREDRKPPESFVSFYHSMKDPEMVRVLDVIGVLKKKKFKISTNGGLLHVSASDAEKDINLTRNIIEFKEEGYPHYGMYYTSQDEVDLVEARTTLLLYSEYYSYGNVAAELIEE